MGIFSKKIESETSFDPKGRVVEYHKNEDGSYTLTALNNRTKHEYLTLEEAQDLFDHYKKYTNNQ